MNDSVRAEPVEAFWVPARIPSTSSGRTERKILDTTSKRVPPIVPFATLLAIVGDLQAQAVWNGKERRDVVVGILGIVPHFARFNACGAQRPCGLRHVLRRIDAQTKMMQARGVSVVNADRARWTKHVAKMSVVVLDVRIAFDWKTVLAKAEF